MNTDDLDDGATEFSAADRWIRSRFNRTAAEVEKALGNYRLDLASQAIYEFTWHEFCDWYLELSKPVLQSDSSSDAEKRGTRRTLIDTLEALLRLIHPLMPFITEEIWSEVAPRAGISGDTIMLSRYPQFDDSDNDPEAELELNWVMQFILGVRQIRGEMDIKPGKMLPVILQNATANDVTLSRRHSHLLERVGRVESITVLADGDDAPSSATALIGDMRLLIPMQGLIDVEAERQRLNKDQEKTTADLARSKGKLDNAGFVSNAPEAVVQQERERVAEFERRLAQICEQLEKLDHMT